MSRIVFVRFADAALVTAPWAQWVLEMADRYRHLLLGATAVVCLAGFNGQWQIEADSALYLSLGRNIARGNGYTYHGSLQTLVYPGLPFALAAMFRLFGGYAIAGCDALILLCGLAAIGLMYRLFYLASDRPTAVVVTVLTGLSHEFFRYCFEIMPEIPFLAAVLAVLAGHEGIFGARATQRGWDWAIFIVGTFAAINLKPMMMPLLAICVVAAWGAGRPARRRAIWMTSIILALLLLFLYYDPRHVATATTATYEKIAGHELQRLPMRWRVEVARNIRDLLGKSAARAVLGTPLGSPIISGIFAVTVLAGGIALAHRRPLWGMWVAATLAKVIFFYSHDRYLIPILPLLMFAWWKILCRISAIIPRHPGFVGFALLMSMTFISNAISAGICVYEQHRRPFLTFYRDGRLLGMSQMANELTQRTGPDDVVLVPLHSSRIATFLGDRTALEPGETLVPLGDRRLVVVAPVDRIDPLQEQWLARMHVVRGGAPLVIVRPPRGGVKRWRFTQRIAQAMRVAELKTGV